MRPFLCTGGRTEQNETSFYRSEKTKIGTVRSNVPMVKQEKRALRSPLGRSSLIAPLEVALRFRAKIDAWWSSARSGRWAVLGALWLCLQCHLADVPCRHEDPGCSDSSLLALLSILYRPSALYWGDSNDNSVRIAPLANIESGISEFLFTAPVNPSIFSVAPDQKWIWFTGGIENTLYLGDGSTGSSTAIDNGYSDIDSIFFASSTGSVFISDSGSSTIYSSVSNWTSHTLLGSPAGPRGLFIHSANSHLYLADNTEISRYDLDFSGYTQIVAAAGDPRDLELDLDHDLIFWSDQTGGAIRKANLDGSSDTQIVSGLNSPFGIALDSANQWVYYCETGSNLIGRVKYDGSAQQTLFSGVGCWDVEISREI